MQVEIRLADGLEPACARTFEDLGQLEVRIETVLVGELTDRAALHGVLHRLRSLGLRMIDARVDDHTDPAPGPR